MDLKISPLKIVITALEVPHEGQGMEVIFLKIQTVVSKFLDCLAMYFKKNNQQYPNKQAASISR
jgi:hypothetical protein